MSVTLKIDNFSSINIIQKTRLGADATAPTTNLTVVNSAGFATSDNIVLGRPGSDGSELRVIQSVTNTTAIVLTVATSLSRARFDEVNSLLGDRIKIYRAAALTDNTQPADASFSLLNTINIQPDQLFTLYTDASGSNAYWYKYTYFNSGSTAETNLSDSIAVRGAATNYCSVDAIREEAGFKNSTFITDAMIDAKRQAAQRQIDSALGGFYTVPFQTPVNAFIADICRRLAAGLLLLQQYGAFGTLNSQNGQSKVDKALADIKWLQSGQGTLKDANGGSMANASVSSFSGWPNGTTADIVNGTGDFKFTIDDRY